MDLESRHDGTERDILTGFWQRTLTLAPDNEGEVVATLIGKTVTSPARRAVLYVHGFVDYFFQAHMADAYVAAGIDFYALDLRKYGRSLRPHQTPNFCRTVDEYFEELDEAVDIIHARGHDNLLLSGHSTGGLIAAIYARERRNRQSIDALFLNSPFFEFNTNWAGRSVAIPTISRLGRTDPHRGTPLTLSPLYGQSLHAAHRGTWDYRLDWKPNEGFPVRAGWVNAIHQAHVQLHAGIDVGCPALVMCSTRSTHTKMWNDGMLSADAVLNVEHITRYADALGPNVSRARIEGGIHDLTLSAAPVRERVFAELFRWCSAYFPEP